LVSDNTELLKIDLTVTHKCT